MIFSPTHSGLKIATLFCVACIGMKFLPNYRELIIRKLCNGKIKIFLGCGEKNDLWMDTN